MRKLPKLYGREHEQALVRNLVADAAAGPGRVLLLRGPAGIGKTALLDDAVDHAVRQRPGTTVLRCTGVESEGTFAFGGLLGLLACVLDRVPELPAPQRHALNGALGLVPAADVGELSVRAAVLSLTRLLTADGPVLLAVDDVQWLDLPTLASVLFAARRAVPRLAVLLTARADPEEDTDTATRDLPSLDLAGLSPPAARALLAARGVRDGDTAALLAVADGNPLALAELPVPDGTSADPLPLDARLREAFAHRARALPPDVRTLLLVAAAETHGRTDAVLAATTRLTSDGAPGLTEPPGTAPTDTPAPADSAAAHLAAAERAALLLVTGPTLRFRHPLVRAAVYADAPFPDRARAHLALAATLTGDDALWHRARARTAPDEELAAALERAADSIAGRGGLAAAASVLARAADLGTDPWARTRRLAAAAHAAWKSGHPETARRLAARAADTPGLLPGPARLELTRLDGLIAHSGGDQRRAFEQLTRAAEAHAPHRPPAATALLFMACDAADHAGLAQALHDTALRIAASAVEPRQQEYGRLLAAAYDGAWRAYPGPLSPGDPWAILRAAPDDLGTTRVHRWLWPSAITRDGPDPVLARDFTRTACERIRAEGVAALLPRPLLWLADLECRTGLFTDAAAHAREALCLTRDLAHPVSRADALALLARIAALHGDEARCRTYAEEASATALPLHNRAAAAEAAWALALLALSRGEHAEARERLLPVHTPGSARAHRRIARLSAADLTQAWVATGDRAAAGPVAKEAAALADRSGLPWARAQAALCRLLLDGTGERAPTGGLTRARTGAETDTVPVPVPIPDTDTDRGTDDWAVADHGFADQPFARARAALAYGERLRRDRRAVAAREQLRSAVDLFDGIGAPVWRDRARAELRAAGASARRGREDPAAQLTPQELQVARLAAQGLSNREIGVRLTMSPRTAGYHLYKVFPKLGLTGRAELRDLDL
ncbi:helix-turn-helix transcriptional regulator [Streptomyces cellulosae]|uniref:AAA family ATPase n=1 Tax=Streptomyces cellulosae TaxID=1968 RepID=A0ABW7YA01_STRCE